MSVRHRPNRRGVDQELDFHIEMQIRRFMADGLDADAARRAALRRLGDLDDVRAACLAVHHTKEPVMTMSLLARGLGQDLRHAARGLRRAPAFTLAAVLTLALGIGATTAIFSVVHAALFAPLPYAHAARTVAVWNSYGESLPKAAVSPPEFADIQETAAAFDAVAALRPQPMNLSGACGNTTDCSPERIDGYRVSPNLFDLLGAGPALGRAFGPGDGLEGATPVVLLSHALWQRRFGGDPAAVGRTAQIDEVTHTIIGVMPASVRFPDEPVGFLREPAGAWIPYAWERSRDDSRGNGILAMIARLAPDQSPEAAGTQLRQLEAAFKDAFADRYAGDGVGWSMTAVPLRTEMVGDARLPLLMLLGAVALVLLIACANVANLMVARGLSRGHDLAVRAALGASRLRLARHVLVEAGLVAGAGLTGGLGLAALGIAALTRIDPGSIPRLETAGLNLTVLAFSVGLGTLCTLGVGLAPGLRHGRGPASVGLTDGRSAGSGTVRSGLRRSLVIAEVALAAIVLVGAGLLARSLAALQQVDTGIVGTDVVVFEVNPPRAQFPTREVVIEAQDRIHEAVGALPGVTATSAVYPLPMSGQRWSGTFGVEGLMVPEGEPQPHAEFAAVLPGYFETIGIRLHEGRDFADSDASGAPGVVVIDESLAETYWPGESAIGKRVDAQGRLPGDELATVIGVVGHVRNGGPLDAGEPQVYLPFRQSPQRLLFGVVRGASGVPVSAASLRDAVARAYPNLPVSNVQAMPDLVTRVLARERFSTQALAGFAIVSLLLSLIGLHGVLSYLVAHRTREIGIRLAIGGRPGQVLGQIVREGVGLVTVGLVLGLGIAALTVRGIGSLLHGVAPTDPLTYAGVAMVLGLSAVAASYLPARRATRVDPVVVLRE